MTTQRAERRSGQRRVGRPALVEGQDSVVLTPVRVPPEFRDRVRAYAEEHNVSIGKLVRDALTEKMERDV